MSVCRDLRLGVLVTAIALSLGCRAGSGSPVAAVAPTPEVATATAASAPAPAPPASTSAPAPAPTATSTAARPPIGGSAVEVSRGSLARRDLALTFDCGGHARGTAEILAALREADVRVTFFMIGDWVRAYPVLAREIASRHEIANHSDTHPDYRDLTDDQIVADLEAADRTFREVMGRSAKPMWRAASGARDQRVLDAAARGGWPLHIFWTLERDAQGQWVTGDSGDWRPFTPEQVAANMLRAAALGNGVITVSHCDSDQTRIVLPGVLRAFREQGIRVTTVSEVLR